MKANRIILCLKDDNKVIQYTSRNLSMTGKNLYFNDLKTDKINIVPLDQIDRIDVFFINVDPFTKEPLMPSSD